MTERAKDVAWLMFVAALFVLAVILALTCAAAKADCTIAFGATWCGPCHSMHPLIEQLRREGHDIRPVDIDVDRKLATAYRVSRIPCFIRVAETPNGNFEVGRITGVCTIGQLRRLEVAPGVVTVGAAARSCVRFVIGSPTPIFPEW